MQPIHTYNVTPKLPEALQPLLEMVYNLWWTWQPDARRLFRHLDLDLWDRTNHSPIRMLQLSKQSRLQEVARDEDFLRDMQEVHARFRAYLSSKETYGKQLKGATISAKNPIAYFSAEFGFHESVPNYSGGLGILSGDHCKSASDLDLPFVAFTLLYRHGYFRQRIDKDGMQHSIELNQNFSHLPLEAALDKDGKPLDIEVTIEGHSVRAKVWKIAVGRITLFLLDTDIPENSPDNRLITAQLYGGDLEMRIKQEIVLGIGGVHALNAMGITPAVHHMNEGHSAFLSLELIRRQVVENKLDFYSALQVVAAGNIFTTHTPVPAGNDAFPLHLMRKYFHDYPGKVGISEETFLEIGQTRTSPHEPFSMTILALRTSRHANGVSKLHGEVSQGLWKEVWEGVPQNEVPITSITNGVHTKTWAAPEWTFLFDKYLPGWEENLSHADPEFWNRVFNMPDEELWSVHQLLKARLVEFARERVTRQRKREGVRKPSFRSPREVDSSDWLKELGTRVMGTDLTRAALVPAEVLRPDILTIGFARRFATYKRATLLFRDLDRLDRLINHPERPVQFLFAGKAHPKDEPGKKFIQEVYKASLRPEFFNKIVFLEDYDTYVGRRLYQGVDLWLNNPRRPLEASGTSGMKLPPNGGLNLSVLDGWWVEAYGENKKSGWAIGKELPNEKQADEAYEDDVDVESLFYLLETRIVPLYYTKPYGDLPLSWLQLMKESIRTVVPTFNTNRMVREYNERLYEPAAKAHVTLGASGGAKAVELSKWKATMRKAWPQIRIQNVNFGEKANGDVAVGEPIPVKTTVELGPLAPENVCVQAYYGLTSNQQIVNPTTVNLQLVKPDKADIAAAEGTYVYEGVIPSAESGSYGLNVRVIPTHPNLTQAHELRLITWAK